MGSPVIWNGRTGKNLSPDGMKAKNGRQELYLEVDPRTTATDANQGDFLSSIYGKFQKLDNGSSTNWKRIDTEHSQHKLYENFEMETVASLPTGWVKYGNTNTTLNYPDNFGGSASTSSYTTVSNTDLSGSKVFRTSVSSSDNGKGVYKAFSIANGEKGLPFTIESQIKITKTNVLEWASNAQIWVVGSSDNFVSNFQNIPLTNYVVSKSGLLKGSFIDPSATLTNFRLCIHFSGLTDTFNVDFDEVKIYSGAQDTLSSIVSEWFSYTPTFQGVGTPTNVNFKYRQVGSSYEIEGAFTAGTTTATTLRIGLPNGAVTKSNLPSKSVAGQVVTSISTSPSEDFAVLKGPSESFVTLGAQQTSQVLLNSINANDWFSSGHIITVKFSVPIEGLNQFGSNVIASGENFMPIKGVKTATQSISAATYTEVIWEDTASDSRFTTSSRFKLPPNGRFQVEGVIQHGASNPYWVVRIFKNGSIVNNNENFAPVEWTVSGNSFNPFYLIVDTKGCLDTDVYSVAVYLPNAMSIGHATNRSTYLNIDRLDKPFSMNLFQAAGMVLSPTDNVLPAKFGRIATLNVPASTGVNLILDKPHFNPTGNIQVDTATGKIYNRGPSGYYKFYGSIRTSASATGYISRKDNANTEVEPIGGPYSSSAHNWDIASSVFYWAKDDFIYVGVWNGGGSSMTIFQTDNSINFERVDKTAVSAGGGYTKWQRKTTSSNLTSGNTFTFNNLEIGKQYKLTIFHQVYADNGSIGSKYLNHNIYHNGAVILQLPTYAYNVGEFRVTWSPDHIFTAQNTTISGNIDSVNLMYMPPGAMFTLEELPQHIQTNQWT